MTVAEALDPSVRVRFGGRDGYFLFTTRSLEWLRTEWDVADFLQLWARVNALKPAIEGPQEEATTIVLTKGGGVDLFAAKSLVIAGALECLAAELADESEMIPPEAVGKARRIVARMVPATLLVLSLQAMTAFYRAMMMPAEMVEEAGEDASEGPTEATRKAA